MACAASSSILPSRSSPARISRCSDMTRWLSSCHLLRVSELTSSQGVLGGLLTLTSFLKFFPQVDTQHPPPGWSASKASNVQGEFFWLNRFWRPFSSVSLWFVGSELTFIYRYHGRRLYPGLLLRRCGNDLVRELVRATQDYIHGQCDHGRGGCTPMLVV